MIVPIIPALNPDEKLLNLVQRLQKDFKKIIIVNDGSESNLLFQELAKSSECVVLTHEVNKGKGEALKTALRYYKDHFLDKYNGVVMIDADGQHSIKDAINLAQKVEKEDKAILGTRLFNTSETPFRNKLGNRITSRVFKMLYGVYLKDTQTGLRAYPNRLIDFLINVSGSRFEYEMNVLIELVKKKEEIVEIDIETVYLHDSNRRSNFKVLKDSYCIYKLMFKNK